MAFDLDDEELKATRRMNGSDKNVACVEENIEGLKRLFYANALTQYGKRKLIDYYEQLIKELEEENQQLEAIKDEAIRRYNLESIPVSSVKEKIEEYEEKAKRIAGTYQYADSGDDLENKKKQVIELRTKAEGLQDFLEGK